MRRPDPHTPDLPGLSFPAQVVPTGRADGAYLVIPGKPVVEEEELTVNEVHKLLGGKVSRRRIQQLGASLGARQAVKRGKLRIPARKVIEFKLRRA